MDCVMGSRALLSTPTSFPQSKEILGRASLMSIQEIGLISTNAALRGRSARRRRGGGGGGGGSSLATPLSFRRIAPERNCQISNAHVLKSVVAAAVLLENEPLMDLSGGQRLYFHRLPSGLRMEVICEKGKASSEGGGGGGGGEEGESSRAPLVFVHGSYHAAWCWACCWLPYFAARGHDCYAISLLGQGASDVPVGKESFTLQSHAGDLAHFIRHKVTAPPVLIGHSFGGLIVQWFFNHTVSTAVVPPSTSIEGLEEPFPEVAAAALVCSTPPTGNGPMVKRFLKRDILASIQITLSLAAKLFGSSLSLCRKSFFSPDMPEEEVQKYQKLLKQSSRHPMIDLRKLNDSLPLPRLLPGALPVFVLAAENDFIVDLEGSQETAEWYGTEPLVISGSGHDIMLDTAWEKAAGALQAWLDQHAL